MCSGQSAVLRGRPVMQPPATGAGACCPAAMVADLNGLLRLKTTVIGMKMFATAEEMAAIPKIRRPSAVHTTDQIVSMASRLGWQVGSTAAELVAAPRRAAMCG